MSLIKLSNNTKLAIASIDGIMGVDLNRILANSKAVTFTYTATEDCFMFGQLTNLRINGLWFNENITQGYYSIPLKKGDNVYCSHGSWNTIVIIYGIKN